MIQYASDPMTGMAQIISTHIPSVVPLNFFFRRSISEMIGNVNIITTGINCANSKPVLIPRLSMFYFALFIKRSNNFSYSCAMESGSYAL